MRKIKRIYTASIVLIFCLFSVNSGAANVACTGVAKTCTPNEKYDKTIEGKAYTCHDCKQVLCKGSGDGPIAGTSTTSVCEAKPTGFTPIRDDDHFSGSTSKNKKPKRRPAPRRAAENQSESFDEADAIFGKRTGRTTTKKERTPVARVRLASPSMFRVTKMKAREITLIWRDNANNEHGIAVERSIPKRERGGVNYDWEQVFKIEERVDRQVKGQGFRSGVDKRLNPKTLYCYRIRAYHGEKYSNYSEIRCASTKRLKTKKRKSEFQDHR